jgi:DNA-binding NarL/FixJ family response regulator
MVAGRNRAMQTRLPGERAPKRIILAQMHRLLAEIIRKAVCESGMEIVAEARSCEDALRMVNEGLGVDVVIAPTASLTDADAHSGLQEVDPDIRILVMSSSVKKTTIFELRLMSADVGLSGIAEAIRDVLHFAGPARQRDD